VRLVPTYRPRPSALHSAHAGPAAGFCTALALVAALYEHPLVLGAAIAASLLAGTAAGVAGELRRALVLSLPLALLIALVNALVYQGGDTVLFRGGELLGWRIEITLEALAAGALAGLRVVALIVPLGGLLSACVDPDDLLRLFRRLSYRSALTASLASRLVPVLARDATRMGEAARCRPVPASRLAVARAALSGALDRAVDVAGALEVRGYARARRPRSGARAWSRHDLRVGGAALLIAVAAIAFKVGGTAWVEPYPRLSLAFGGPELMLSALVLASAAIPFAGRGARLGVARV
jgi:energy-coupling factor transport system permease protein